MASNPHPLTDRPHHTTSGAAEVPELRSRERVRSRHFDRPDGIATAAPASRYFRTEPAAPIGDRYSAAKEASRSERPEPVWSDWTPMPAYPGYNDRGPTNAWRSLDDVDRFNRDRFQIEVPVRERLARRSPPPPPPPTRRKIVPYHYNSNGEARLPYDLNPYTEISRLEPSVVTLLPKPYVHVDPFNPRDVTIHTTLEAIPHAERFLEDAARLCRLGHFDAALAQFEHRLLTCMGNMYVLVQYGHCLFEAGQYRKLADLSKKYPWMWQHPETDLSLNWGLLLRKAEGTSHIEFQSHDRGAMLDQVVFYRLSAPDIDMDSTRIQTLILAVGISDGYHVMEHVRWKRAYESLQQQQRVWEFKDLYLALIVKLGLREAYELLFGRQWRTEPTVDGILADWGKLDKDESLYFGGLDLFASLACAYMKYPGNLDAVERLLHVAEKYATHLLEQDIRNLKSRPCFMWMMAKVIFERYKGNDKRNNNISIAGHECGEYRTSSRIFPHDELPLYAPFGEEVPEWRPTATGISDESKETTRIVLRGAKELGDIAMQVACLHQRLDQGSDNPEVEVGRICDLWMEVGNMAAYLRLQLFKFMLIKTDAERQALRRDILDQGECLSKGFTEYARCMILRALTSKTWEKDHYLGLAEALDRDEFEFSDSEKDEHDGLESDLGSGIPISRERPRRVEVGHRARKEPGTKEAHEKAADTKQKKKKKDEDAIKRQQLEREVQAANEKIKALTADLDEAKAARAAGAELFHKLATVSRRAKAAKGNDKGQAGSDARNDDGSAVKDSNQADDHQTRVSATLIGEDDERRKALPARVDEEPPVEEFD